jgi:hypothetical protein
MNDSSKTPSSRCDPPKPFVEGTDFYFEDGLMVLTRRFLLDRGFCCGNGCRHCPYDENCELQ